MLTREQIDFLNLVCPGEWEEENDVINTAYNINLTQISLNLIQIPVQFGHVNGHFNCRGNKLTTLKGTPSIINDYFTCDLNQLTSLEYGPKTVLEYYSCSHNKLTDLLYATEICNADFYCQENQLTSLKGCPKLIGGNFYCHSNPNLKYLWGIGKVKGSVYYDNNNNEINKWIIECMRKDIIFPHFTLEENMKWIKMTGLYSILLTAPQEIRQMFSNYELTYIDMLC